MNPKNAVASVAGSILPRTSLVAADATCTPHPAREHPVGCVSCGRPTWEHHAVCLRCGPATCERCQP